MKNTLQTKFWKNKKVFITGHTGFKGAWLCLILHKLGAKIVGYSLKPKRKSLYNQLKINKFVIKSYYNNIKNYSALKKSVVKFNPDVIFHLAAQPLVIESYKKPIETFDTNIIGTANLIDSIRNNLKLKVKSLIIITTDKVYDTSNKKTYTEKDKLGASDPYSTSKACCELVCESYIKSFKNIGKILATARAGNVIGGGDYSKNRLVPDILNAARNKKKLIIRNPSHIRPWQHVFEPLNGYILLAQKIYKSNIKSKEPNWNFGPDKDSCKSVNFITKKFNKKLSLKIKFLKNNHVKENSYLKLNNNKSKKYLNWKPKWLLDEAILKIIEWDNCSNKTKLKISLDQIDQYFSLN